MKSMSETKGFKTAGISGLREVMRGQVLMPGETGYDEARRVWNGTADRRPALIARCADVADVQRALGFAVELDLPVAVRGGGHSVPGFSTCDDGVVIDLGLMRTVSVDAKARVARAQPGVTGAEFDRATQNYGLATTLGVVSTTGIAGLTLGGGIGWLMRKHGLACDNLLSVDLVTADGRLVTASADENPELFWGLKGGGGNFGIVTSFEYRLHPVGPEVYGGSMAFASEHRRAVLESYRELTANGSGRADGVHGVDRGSRRFAGGRDRRLLHGRSGRGRTSARPHEGRTRRAAARCAGTDALHRAAEPDGRGIPAR